MNDKIKTTPTPIQRNCYDVAVELTQLYFQKSDKSVSLPDDISEIFAKFFAVATLCEVTSGKDLKKLLPDGLKDMLYNR